MTNSASPARPNEMRELIGIAAAGLAVALLLRIVLFQPFTIPSGSMEPGLLVGDYVVMSKFDYGWSRYALPLGGPPLSGRLFGRQAARGDIVVFDKPGPVREDVVKRVIGLPGDLIQVRGGVVSVNGAPIPRQPLGLTVDPSDPAVPVLRLQESAGRHRFETLDRGDGYPGDDTGIYRVPADSYFVMGDNRDNSADSRWPEGQGMGFVPMENVVGRARFVLASWKPGASLFKPWTWLNLRGGRFLRPLP